MNNFGLGLVLNFTDRATSGINLAVGSFQRLNTMAERVGKTTDTTRQSFEEMVIAGLAITSIGYVAETTGDMVVNAFEKIIESTIEVGSYFEQTRITLSTLFQSDTIAEDKIDWLLNFAKTTPFDVENLTSAFVSMKAMGVDASTELQMASGATQSLMGYLGDLNAYRPDLDMSYIIRGVRNAMGGNIRSLDMILDIDSESLIGKTFDNIETDLPALVQALGVEGMMANLEGTWQQKLTNIGDAWTILALRISDAGLFAGAKEILDIVADYLGSLTSDENEERLFAIAQVLSDAFTSILEPLKGVTEWLVNLTDKFIDFAIANPELVQSILKVVAVFGALMLGIGTVFQLLGPAITAFSTFGLFMTTMGQTTTKTTGLIAKLSGGFGKFLPIIGFVVAGFFLLKEAYDRNILGLQDFVNFIVEKASPVVEGLGILIQGVFGDLNEQQAQTAEEMGLTSLIDGFRDFNEQLKEFWDENNEWIIDGAIFVALATGIGKVAKAFKDLGGIELVMLIAKNPGLAAVIVGTVGPFVASGINQAQINGTSTTATSETTGQQWDIRTGLTSFEKWWYEKFYSDKMTEDQYLNDYINPQYKFFQDQAYQSSGYVGNYADVSGSTIQSPSPMDILRNNFLEFMQTSNPFNKETWTTGYTSPEYAPQGVKDWETFKEGIEGLGAVVDKVKQDWNTFSDNFVTFFTDLKTGFDTLKTYISENPPFQPILDFFGRIKQDLNKMIIWINDTFGTNLDLISVSLDYDPLLSEESDSVKQQILGTWSTLPEESLTISKNTSDNMIFGIEGGNVGAGISAQATYDAIMTAINPLAEQGEPIGTSVTEGLVRGMEAVSVISPTQGLVDLVITAFKKGFDINSPSGETQWIGENLIYGLINGMSIGDLASFANSLTNTLVTAFTNGMLTATEILSVLGEKAKSKLKELGIVFGSTYGDLVLPNAPITSDFGWRDPFMTDSGEWSSSYHEGVDYGLPWGFPVGSAGDGEVSYAGWYGGYGNTVKVDHGDGLTSMYAHLSSILVTLGQIVEAGDILGLVGSTGNSTGAHLHFGLYQDGVAIDPLQGFAKGVNSFVGGLALINEQGGEIVNLPNGSQVIPNDKTVELSKTQGRLEAYERLVKQGGNKQVISQDDNSLVFEKESVVIHVHGTTDRDLDDVAETLMKKIDRLRYLKSIGSRNSLFKKV